MGDSSALVFRRYEQGEVSAITTDLDLGPMSVLQFDVSEDIQISMSLCLPRRRLGFISFSYK